MDKPTRYLIVGFVISTLICTVGYLTSIYEKSQVRSLVEKCNAETSGDPKGPWLNYQKIPLVCDPATLSELGVSDPVGIQKEIVAAQSNAGRTFDNAIIVASIVFGIFAIPYSWYFLLCRIRELRDAITGR